jgi:hypothetical protein
MTANLDSNGLRMPVFLPKPKLKEQWDQVGSTYKWHFRSTSQNHFGSIFTGFSKRLGFPEFPKVPGYDHVRLLLDKIRMLQNNHYLFEKASRIDFFVKVFDENTDSFMWECFLSICPTAYWYWQPLLTTQEKWEPLRAWITEFYHRDYTQHYVTRESFFADGKNRYVEKYRSQPLTDKQKATLSKFTDEQILNPLNLPNSMVNSFENCCRLLNYMHFVRKLDIGSLQAFMFKLNEFNPELNFSPLKPTRY